MIACNNLEILISIKTKALKILQIKWNIYSMQETSLFLDDSDCSVFLPAARDSVCWKKREFQIITVLWCKNYLNFLLDITAPRIKKKKPKRKRATLWDMAFECCFTVYIRIWHEPVYFRQNKHRVSRVVLSLHRCLLARARARSLQLLLHSDLTKVVDRFCRHRGVSGSTPKRLHVKRDWKNENTTGQLMSCS